MKRERLVAHIACLTLLGMLVAATPAHAEGIDDFALTKAVPADAFMVAHSRGHEGMAFVNKQFERVWKAVEKQHFENDLRRMLKQMDQQQGGDVQAFEEQWRLFSDLLAGVDWATLTEREAAFAMKLGFPVTEFLFLFMPPADKVEQDFKGLSALLQTLKEMAPEGQLILTTEGEGDSVRHTLSIPQGQMPFALTLARHQEVLMIGFGQSMPEQSLAMLHGEGGRTLSTDERFQAAFKYLPAPRDGFVFVDLAKLMNQLRTLMSNVMAMADPTGETMTDKQKQLPSKIIDLCDICEYVAGVTRTDGLKTLNEEVVVLREDAKNKALYGALFGNAPIEKPLKYIPKEASGFSTTTGVDLSAMYGEILRFLKEEAPDGDVVVQQWEATKAQLIADHQFDVEADLINLIQGGIKTFTIPGPTAYSPAKQVFMLSVTDEEKTRALVDRGLTIVAGMLKDQNGNVVDAQIEGAEGFKVVESPMLAMMLGRPTVGVKDGHLFIATNPDAIAKALAVAAGEAPSFAQNPRFEDEGLPVMANTTSMSFSDLSQMGEQLGQALQMVPMIAAFAPDVAGDPTMRTLLQVLGKVGQVVRELNFYRSSCSITTFEGRISRTKGVLNYQEPPKPMKQQTDDESGDAGDAETM